MHYRLQKKVIGQLKIMANINDILIDHIKSPGPWLSRKSSTKAGAIGLLAAVFLIGLRVYPQHIAKEGEVIYPVWQFVYLIALPTLCFLLWLLLTQIYLRSGSGYKIGIAYEANKIDESNWKKTQDILKDFFRDKKIQKQVSLRFVPSAFSHENNKAVAFAKRYKFRILASIQEITPNNPGGHTAIQIRVESKPQYDAFLKTVFPQGITLHKRSQSNTLLEILDAHAQNLRDILLLFVGTTLFHSERYEDAAVILRHLDKTMERTLSPSQSPRLQVRNLDMLSRLARARFPIAKMPPYEELNEIKQIAETTLCYLDEFHDVASGVARIRFLTGDIAGAIELTQRAIDIIDHLEKSGVEVNPGAKAVMHLNYAFLSYVQGHWDKFYESFKIVLNDESYKLLNWNDLVDWADYVDSLEQFDGIILLKVVYGFLAGKNPDKNIVDEAKKWASSDNSRCQLVKTLNRCMNLPKDNSRKHGKKQRK